ncbi:MAG: secretin N-terminal domain-containing protein [Phycisphaerales bacterium]
MSGSIRHVVVLCAAVTIACLADTPVGIGLCPVRGQTDPCDTPSQRNPFAGLVAQEPPEAPVADESPVVVRPPDLQLETIVLKFLDAKGLKEVLDKMVSPDGVVAINEKTNSVIVCDTAENLRRILAEVKKVDQTPRQIMVEVVIMDVQLRDDTEIGVNWDLLSSDLYDVVYRQNLTSSRLQSTMSNAETIGSATVFNTVGTGGDLSLISGTIRHVLHAIQQKRNVEILASPSTLVVSGQSATIKAVEEIPYEEIVDTAQGGAGALTSTEFKEVGVNLQVSATVTDGNNIFLTVDTEQNVRTGESARGVPIVDTRHATTALLLKDGQTIVIGGLRRVETVKEINQIPILGDLPLIGFLFRSTGEVTTRSELVVLLSPHIFQDDPISPVVLAEHQRIREMSLLSQRSRGPDEQDRLEAVGEGRDLRQEDAYPDEP